MYDMLGLFTYEQTDESNFKLSFEIPENCFYSVTQSGNDYTVAIKLNPGEDSPSKVFVGCDEDLGIPSKVFITGFEQYQKSGTIIKKPKTTIEF